MNEQIRWIGRTVLYFSRAGNAPWPAMITAVHGEQRVDLTVFRPGTSPMHRERVPKAPTEADRALAALADATVPNLHDQWCWHPDDVVGQQKDDDDG